MHAIMKFHMRRRYRYECDVPHFLPLNGKYHMFCSRENKQRRVFKIGVHYGVWFVAKFNKGYLNAITYFYCINLPFDMYKIV